MRISHFPLGAAAFVFMALLVPAAFAQVDPQAPAPRNVTFAADDGTPLHAYLALPAGSGRGPAIVMIHEWWGLNNDTAALADALAAQGYVVLAADAFRGSVARTAAEASRQVSTTPAAQIASDLDSALSFLESQPRVDPARVGVVGFCFGGSQAMRMGTRRGDLSAVVIFYGSGPITDASQLGVMKEAGPVLGIYGAEDRGIPPEAVAGFRAALDSIGVPNEITVYPGVGHAFVKSTTYRNGDAAEAAWSQMITFLHKTL